MAQLSGVVDASTADVVISDIGTVDWIAYDAANGFNRKSGGGAVIADVSALGSATLGEVSALGPSTMSWVGGTPDATGSQSGCLFASPDNAGDGGRSTVPADTTVRVVTLFLYSFSTAAQLVATLSDGSAAPITLVPTGAWSGSAFNCTITYQAGSAGQTLQLDFTSTAGGSLPCWRGIALALGAAPADQPLTRRRRTEDPPPRRRLFAPIPPADNPPPARQRREEESPPVILRVVRELVPPPPGVVDNPPPRCRPRREEDVTADLAARRVRLVPQPAVTPDNPPPRASTARARMLADESRLEPDPRPRKPMQRPAGLLSITTDTSTAAVDLTAIGTSDWRTWVGTSKPADTRRKISGGSQISDWSVFGGGSPSWTPGIEPNVVQWTDGDPVPSGSHNGILWTIDTTGGFVWTVPASPAVRTLHLYLDVIAGGSYANIAAFMSDGTSADTFLGNFVDGEWNVHIAYSTPNPSATLTVYFVPGGAATECRVRGLALAGPAYVPDSFPWARRLWQALLTWDTEEPRARKRFAPIPPPPPPDNPPPRAKLRREEEPESITGRIVRKLVPPPPAVVNNPPPRAGRSNWRVAWDTWEPLEIIRRAVRRMLFPGVIPPASPILAPPLALDFDDTELTIEVDDGTLSVDFDE